MKLAKDFLSKFKNLTPPDDALKRAVAHAVDVIAGVPVRKKDVSISHGVAYVNSSSIARSVIRTHRVEILEQIFGDLPNARDQIRDIR